MNKVENRFPNCAAFNDIHAIANYIDPAFKGVHIEELGVMQLTKDKILQRWKHLEVDEAGDGRDGTEDVEVQAMEAFEDPTLKLIRARKRSGDAQAEAGAGRTSQLKKEMEFFEANVGMEDLKPDGDRLDWWKKHENMLPLLSKVAKQVLGIPCSSAKSERVFSTGGMMVSKKRHRLKSTRVENLLVIKENRKLVEEFKERSGRNVEVSTDAFKSVIIEVDDSLVEAPPISALFEEAEETDGGDFSSDDEFEVVCESV